MSKLKMAVPMAEGKEFDRIPDGSYLARIYQVIDMGTHESDFQGNITSKHKFAIRFETPTEMTVFKEEDGKQPFSLTSQVNFSITGKESSMTSTLTKIIASVGDEPERGYNIFDLIGKVCMVTVKNEVSNNGKTYSNIKNFAPVPKLVDASKYPAINETKEFSLMEGMFDAETLETLGSWTKEKIMESPEYHEAISGFPTGKSKPAGESEAKESEEIDLDDLEDSGVSISE